MSVRFDRGGWEVRWLDGSGRKRAKRFKDEQAARAFDASLENQLVEPFGGTWPR
jgi:hypothetical protein